MKKILVTGATGFIGRHALPLLLNKGYEVHAVSSRPVKTKDKSYIWHQADLTNSKQRTDLITKVDPSHLLHFAWYAEHKKYWTSSKNLKWVQASLNLLDIFHENGGQRVLMAGTCAEYSWKHTEFIESTTPTNPGSLYGTCKHSLQLILESFSKTKGLSSAWGRIFFLFGPGEHPERLVSFVIQSLLKGKKAPCSKGDQIRDFLYVEDVASAFVSVLESNIQGPVNIGSGEPVKVKDLIALIGKKVGRSDLIRLGENPTAPDDPENLVADTTKLRQEVNWSPKYDLNSGIDQTIQWWKDKLDREIIKS